MNGFAHFVVLTRHCLKKPTERFRGGGRLALLCVMLACFYASPALGGKSETHAEPLLWVSPVFLGQNLGAAELASVEQAMQHAFARVPGLDIRDARRASIGMDEPPKELYADLNRAAKYLQEGQEHLLNLNLDEAFEAFQSARVTYRRHLAWLEDSDPLLHSLLGLAEVFATQGDSQAALMAYEELLVLSPGYEPNQGLLPDKYMSLFEQARDRIEKAEKGGLVIETRPPGARVMLDGLNLGKTLVIKEGLTAGLHGLSVQLDGFVSVRQIIEIQAGESYPLDLELEPLDLTPEIKVLREALAKSSDRDGVLVHARRLAARAGVRAVLLGQLSRLPQGGLVLTLVVVTNSLRPPTFMGVRWPEAGDVEPVARSLAWKILSALRGAQETGLPVGLGLQFNQGRLLGALPAAPRIVKVPQVVHRPLPANSPVGAMPGEDREGLLASEGKKVPVWGKWWFWTGLGMIVAGGVATTLVLTLGPEVRTEYDPDLVRVQLVRSP